MSLESIKEKLMQEFDVEPEVVETDLNHFTSDLLDLGIIKEEE